MALAGTPGNGLAMRGWCRSDPVILIEGIIVDIFCTAPLTVLLHVTGPNEIVISVPVGVSTTLLLAGVGFGRGELVRIEETERLQRTQSTIAIEVEVYVPANTDLPIGVELARNVVGILSPARAEGTTNQWITLATELPTGILLSPGEPGTKANTSGGEERRGHKRRGRGRKKKSRKRH